MKAKIPFTQAVECGASMMAHTRGEWFRNPEHGDEHHGVPVQEVCGCAGGLALVGVGYVDSQGFDTADGVSAGYVMGENEDDTFNELWPQLKEPHEGLRQECIAHHIPCAASELALHSVIKLNDHTRLSIAEVIALCRKHGL